MPRAAAHNPAFRETVSSLPIDIFVFVVPLIRILLRRP
jgi:hypothetical protein